ncbi:ABC transporter permease [Neobacillus sp. OS1-2]|uniref:ABC transporter permease n=1 Tax=Neobacillus sp. OS1-2 TaxID=3070680 RepID=UPI0027DFCF17|nr:ABC transporter permease [Neobacillus sp. OS1-2]WML41348.1 ABC transporter permease [Neobacillus sp. OS1-2]
MNILHIAWKGIKSDFRDRRTLFFMLAFPILLILVLGTALSNTFTSSLPVDDLHVLYKDTTQEGSFQQFRAGAEASGIHFKKAADNMDGKKEVKQDTYDGYIEVSDKGVQLYINNGNSINANILQGMLTAYVDKFNIAFEIRKTAPDKLEEAFTSGTQANFIKETSLNPEKKPGSLDYYAIAITTMIVLYGAMSASSLIVGERVRKTADRLIAAPVRKSEIFIGKVLGSLISNGLCVILVILFSKLFFKANWGNHLGLVFLVLLSEVVLAVSIGIGLSFLAKTSGAPQVIIMLFVQLSSFFGGAYFKIENPEGIFKLITDLSPLTWMNTAITKIIYANDFAAAIPAIGINLIGSFLLLLVAIISLQRREGL